MEEWVRVVGLRDKEPEEREKDCEMLFSGHDTAIVIIIFQQLQLPTLGLHKTEQVSSQVMNRGGCHRAISFPKELLTAYGF